MSVEREVEAHALPEPDAALEWAAMAPTDGTICALLTPAIRAKLREMEPGQVLEVRVSDVTAREDITSWCRLSGNELIAMTEDSQQLRAYVRKKPD